MSVAAGSILGGVPPDRSGEGLLMIGGGCDGGRGDSGNSSSSFCQVMSVRSRLSSGTGMLVPGGAGGPGGC